MSFVHLHVHSHYSILDGMTKIPALVNKAIEYGMPAVALTDHGCMFGVKDFLDTVGKVNKARKADNLEPFKPIVGIEAYCARRTRFDKDKDYKKLKKNGKEYTVDASGYHLILLAKNKKGYQNLCKLASLAWIDGFYHRARVDRELLEKYNEGIIASSACIGGEVAQHILNDDLQAAEDAAAWHKSIFGDDYYIEIQRHKTDKPRSSTEVYTLQEQVNPHLIAIAKKLNIKVIATNDVHFLDENHSEAHDRLICLSTGANLDDEKRMQYTKQEWLKSPDQMRAIFNDIPEAIENTLEIANKVEIYSIDSGPLMPKFDIPADFATEQDYHDKYTDEQLFNEFTQNEKGEVVLSKEEADKKINALGGYEKLYRIKLEADYLAMVSWQGAEKRYGKELTDEQRERIIFELHIMKTMGFPGYFLIVWDYIRAAREELGVSVGPGRGSAAGSVVAYCLRITDVDPLKYDLLFERFLNPDRISMPDIDVDFDDDGRGAVLDWVTNKYGKDKVAHIITYGAMATKSALKDVGRVQQVPLPEVQAIVDLVPDRFPEDPKSGKAPKVNVKSCIDLVPEMQRIRFGANSNLASMLEYAAELEGTNRQTGMHACGVIIGADDLTNHVPLSTIKDRETGQDIVVTEYDGHVVESVGLIKMDFLGLSTLSLIKEAIKNIHKSHNVDIDIDAIPIDDEKTYQLYSAGRTVGTFQFESGGMQKYLRELKPTKFEDLIAMNALYRPGPMDYIPQFIARKHGTEEIVYDIQVTEKYLKDTYGITVYQEQVMLLSRLLADFTRGESDLLRKAMGKKIFAVLDQLKPKFIQGGEKNGHDPVVLEKIWKDWEKFASYAFNKSHATCYSWVAYQTAYLKAHYPAEFMAACLTRNRDDIKEVTKFMEECQAMNINILGPDINESDLNFIPNKTGDIRCGLGGVKGVGKGAVLSIVEEREKNGRFKDIFDFFERISLKSCNKKVLESLVLCGAFDELGMQREQFFVKDAKETTFLETMIRFANMFQADSVQSVGSLFDDLGGIEIKRPEIPVAELWSNFEKLKKEKELIGIYLSAHPLDEYKVELKTLANTSVSLLSDLQSLAQTKANSQIVVGGITNKIIHGVSKNNKPYAKLQLEDYDGSYDFFLIGKQYLEYKHYLESNLFILITGNVQERTYYNKQADDTKPKVFDFNISKIDLLEDLKGSAIKNITINLPLQSITQELIFSLTDYVNNTKGLKGATADLYVNISDGDSKYVVNSLSKKKIAVTADLLDLLDSYQKAETPILTYFLNARQ